MTCYNLNWPKSSYECILLSFLVLYIISWKARSLYSNILQDYIHFRRIIILYVWNLHSLEWHNVWSGIQATHFKHEKSKNLREVISYICLSMRLKKSLSTTSIMDHRLLCQKVCQIISVIKTNTCDDIQKYCILAFWFTLCLEDNRSTTIQGAHYEFSL